MATVGKLTQQGELQVSGSIDTRLPLVTDGLIAHYPMDGTTDDSEQVVWKNLVGMSLDSFDSNILVKTNGVSNWVSGAQSVQAFSTDGIFLEWRMDYVDLTHGAEMVGFNHNHSTNSYTDIDFAIYTHYNKNVSIYENGSNKGTKSTWDLTSANIFRIEIINNTVKYYHNGTLIYTSLNIPTFPLYVDCSFHSHGAANSIINAKVGRMALTSSNITITDDYVAIEEATTNIIPGFPATNVGYNVTRTASDIVNPFDSNAEVEKWTTDASSLAYRGWRFNVTAGVRYTASAYIFDPYGHNSQFTLHDSATNFTSIISTSEDVGDGWARKTVSGIAATTEYVSHGLIIYVNSVAGNHFWISQPQIQAKDYATDYIDGSKSDGALTIPNPVRTGNYSVSFDVKRNVNVGHAVTYSPIISMGRYSVNNSWTIMDTGNGSITGTSRLIREGSAAQWNWLSTADLTTPANFNDWNTITLTRDSTNYRVYSNGVYLGLIAHYAATMEDTIYVGGSNDITRTSSALIKNLSIYNRALSDDEVKKLAKGTHSITSNGLISKHPLKSTPYHPDDAYYFDLGYNGKDAYKVVVPSEDTANYSSGDAYVGGNSLEYNLNASIGLNWGGDWSICYMKKPIGTSGGSTNLTVYNIESLGCNSNSVGGGYIFWGKAAGSYQIYLASNAAFSSADYFNNWEYVTLVKSGATLTITSYLKDSVFRTRTISLGSPPSNYYVTQYGYDFKLSGWDNNGGCYTHFRNLIVLKRAMSSAELDSYRLNKMKATKDGLYVQNGISSGIIL